MGSRTPKSVKPRARRLALRYWILLPGDAAEHVAQTSEKAKKAEDEHEVGLGMQPAIEEVSDEATDGDTTDHDEGKLHGGGELTAETGRAFFRGNELLGFVVVIVRRHSGPIVRMAQDTTQRPE